MTKKRAERVKEKLLTERRSRVKERQEKNAHDRLAHESRKKQVPIVNLDKAALQRNNKKLQEMAAEYAAMLKFKEDNKEKIEEHFDALKKEQSEIAEQFNDNTSTSIDSTERQPE